MKQGKGSLLIASASSLFSVFAALSVLLFVSAGSLKYWGGWLGIGIFLLPTVLSGIYLFINEPDTLKRRLRSKEQRKQQRALSIAAKIIVTIGVVLAGLDYRFSISRFKSWVHFACTLPFAISCIIYAFAFKENRYLHRSIYVEKNQKTIDTGIYSHIRHPMYLATVFLYSAFAIAVGSWLTIAVFALLIPVLCARIRDEEVFLEASLANYKDYKSKVKYKLIPYVW